MQATEQTKAPGTGEGLIPNHPANIESVYAGVAALRGMAVEDLSGVVEANFERLFGRAGGT
jgi:Tat protein secretion system quality control protein TatD with DNase activity